MTITDTASVPSTVGFTVNGQPVSVRADHPHLLAALREELDITSPKDGCSPSGQCGCCTVLVDGTGRRVLPAVAGEGGGPGDHDPRGLRSGRAAALRRRLRGLRRAAVRLLHPRHRRAGQGPGRQEGRRPHPGGHGPPPGRPPVPLHGVREGAGGHRVGGGRARSWRPTCRAASGPAAPSYEARELTLGDRGYVDDLRVPGMLHAALRLTDHARADIHRIDIESARAAPGVVAVLTAADIPGALRVGIIHTDWPIMIPEGGRTSYAGDVLAIVVAETRQQARAAAELVEVDYGVLRPLTDAVAALDDPEISVWGTDSNTLSVSEYRRGDVEAALGGQRARGRGGVPHPAHRARLPGARGHPGRARRRGRHDARVLGRAGGVGRPQPDRLGPRGRPVAHHRRAGVQRRSVRRQGGHGQPGPRRLGRMAAPAPGEVRAVARGEPPHAPQTPPHRDGLPGRLRCGWPPHRGPCPDGGRFGCVRRRWA